MNNILVFDLDGTLCSNEEGKYKEAKPFEKRIAFVNKLYDNGNTIIIDTARGSLTRKDWEQLTKSQLKKWGLKYHILKVGTKTFGHMYIDDSAINAKLFFK